MKIRFRVDGVLRNILTLPKAQVAPLLSRLKIMANLNIAEHRLPQDGQSRVSIGDELVDIRVSVIPTAGGERVVLRLLDKGRGELKLEEVGFGPELLKIFRSLIGISHGIVLITGPTGSGKTTTLYAALNELNCQERNILTVEDPVEYQLPGIGQMQVRPKIDLTFANCLRHILRQDPDIIMIGEIRDRETAEIAIQASLTGHLVLSTLHTNDAASAVTRLTDMGIEPYLISSTVVGVMAQRLVRVICPDCKQPYDPQDGDRLLDRAAAGGQGHSSSSTRAPAARSACRPDTWAARGIFELLLVDDRIRNMIVSGRRPHLIKQAAVEKGMTTLRQDGLRRALAGVTTLEEVYRVTQDSVQIAGGGRAEMPATEPSLLNDHGNWTETYHGLATADRSRPSSLRTRNRNPQSRILRRSRHEGALPDDAAIVHPAPCRHAPGAGAVGPRRATAMLRRTPGPQSESRPKRPLARDHGGHPRRRQRRRQPGRGPAASIPVCSRRCSSAWSRPARAAAPWKRCWPASPISWRNECSLSDKVKAAIAYPAMMAFVADRRRDLPAILRGPRHHATVRRDESASCPGRRGS